MPEARLVGSGKTTVGNGDEENHMHQTSTKLKIAVLEGRKALMCP